MRVRRIPEGSLKAKRGQKDQPIRHSAIFHNGGGGEHALRLGVDRERVKHQ
jgi:hypothetical protein